MLEILVEQRFYVTAVLLFSIGFATLLLHPNLIKEDHRSESDGHGGVPLPGGHGLCERREGPHGGAGAEAAAYINPVPGGLVLTGIVVAVSTTALFWH